MPFVTLLLTTPQNKAGNTKKNVDSIAPTQETAVVANGEETYIQHTTYID